MLGAAIVGQDLSDREFLSLSELMHKAAAIHLPLEKKNMVACRLINRIRALGIAGFQEYIDLIRDERHREELQFAVNLLTTHETYFFREPHHFDYLKATVLPTLQRECRAQKRPLRVWSAATSTGEEAYSLAMTLMAAIGETVPWEVLGTDVSSSVLEKARRGIYGSERLELLPKDYLWRYCTRGVGSDAGAIVMHPSIRGKVRFTQMNLASPLEMAGMFDIVFLRNVLFYFDAETKRSVLSHLCRQINPGGWLFVGHAESLNGVGIPLDQQRPTVYRKTVGVLHAGNARQAGMASPQPFDGLNS